MPFRLKDYDFTVVQIGFEFIDIFCMHNFWI